MQSKKAIERQIQHFKHGCATNESEKHIWIKALEWVLGDDPHRIVYEEFLESIRPEPLAPGATVRERVLHYQLRLALNRLE